jgi:hypothetical protein
VCVRGRKWRCDRLRLLLRGAAVARSRPFGHYSMEDIFWGLRHYSRRG